MAEYIFLDTDPSFEIVLRAVTELRNQGRLPPQFLKRSTIKRVKSANQNPLYFRSLNGLSRRLSLCARICMADSAGMNPMFWRVDNVYDRNLSSDNFSSEVYYYGGVGFNLAAANGRQQKYCSEYDRLYPHYIIEEKLNCLNRRIGGTIYIPSTMFVIRQQNPGFGYPLAGFSEIIQIDTTMNIIDYRPNNEVARYNCYISVVTSKSGVLSGVDGKFTRVLQALCICYGRTQSREVCCNWESDELSRLIKN